MVFTIKSAYVIRQFRNQKNWIVILDFLYEKVFICYILFSVDNIFP